MGAGVLDKGHAGRAVALDAQQIHQADGGAGFDVVDDNAILDLVNVQHFSVPPLRQVPWGRADPAGS